MSWRHIAAPVLLLTLPLLAGACASGGRAEGDTETMGTMDDEGRPSRAGTGVLVVQNQTSESVEIYVGNERVGTVAGGESQRFPEMPTTAATVEARGSGGAVVDTDNLDFASAGDNTVTFVVDGT
ncbi:MAG: hypothetical protein ABR599_08820 [Gemmatimonadota bacterium]